MFSNPCISPQYSRSEVVLTFFERSPLDQVLKNDNVHKIQPSFQSPVKISGKSCKGGVGGGAAVEAEASEKPSRLAVCAAGPCFSRKTIQEKWERTGKSCCLIPPKPCVSSFGFYYSCILRGLFGM